MSVVVTHNSGFFSCCSVRLDRIINFVYITKSIPVHVDSSQQFIWYKGGFDGDITHDYFIHYDSMDDVVVNPTARVIYTYRDQFKWYSSLEYASLEPLVKKYFTPSDTIVKMGAAIEKKYAMDLTKTCVLFYRGNDKVTETRLCGYGEYIDYANRIIANDPDIRLLIQSDETQFIECMMKAFPDRAMHFNEEIRHMSKRGDTVDNVMCDNNPLFSKYYLAITIIMSKCKYVVCGSGNCSVWIMLYRGNMDGVYQNLNGVWRELENKVDEKNARNVMACNGGERDCKKRMRNMFNFNLAGR